jgi:hypothetical protein
LPNKCVALFAIDRLQPDFISGQTDNAKHSFWTSIQHSDDPRRVASPFGGDPSQHTIADTWCRYAAMAAGTSCDHNSGYGAEGLIPLSRRRDQIAVACFVSDLDHTYRGQFASAIEPFLSLLNQALIGHLAQHLLQRNAICAFYAERA